MVLPFGTGKAIGSRPHTCCQNDAVYEGFYNNKGPDQGLGQTSGNIKGPEDLPENAAFRFQIQG